MQSGTCSVAVLPPHTVTERTYAPEESNIIPQCSAVCGGASARYGWLQWRGGVVLVWERQNRGAAHHHRQLHTLLYLKVLSIFQPPHGGWCRLAADQEVRGWCGVLRMACYRAARTVAEKSTQQGQEPQSSSWQHLRWGGLGQRRQISLLGHTGLSQQRWPSGSSSSSSSSSNYQIKP
jgi:hypothetical protein